MSVWAAVNRLAPSAPVQAVAKHWPTFVAAADEAERSIPKFVRREFAACEATLVDMTRWKKQNETRSLRDDFPQRTGIPKEGIADASGR